MTDWINKDTRLFMSRGYLRDGETVEERIKKIADTAEFYSGIKGFSKEFEQQLLNGWISLASPIWSNYGTERGLPISCNGSYIDDTIESILWKSSEIGMQTKHGAGTSAYLGAIRPRGSAISVGGMADGPVHFSGLINEMIKTITQSNVRRGSCAIYLPVEHPDIWEFLEIREEGNPIQDLSIGVTITDKWMQDMIDGDKDKRKIWTRILRKRSETGYPYIFWSDTVNNSKPDVYKDLGYEIYASNLCTEIALPSTSNESFVCCLSSLNILKYDEWKDTNVVDNLVIFLNTVLDEYMSKIELGQSPFLVDNLTFAETHRAIGIGTLGWHSYLQSKSISFESEEASHLNEEIHKLIHDNAYRASRSLVQRGLYSGVLGTDRANATLLAIAPTTSSSFILGQVSPSIEPLNSNYFVKDLAKGKFTYRNPFLKSVLQKLGKDTEEVWDSILLKGGSVQHLDFLSDHEKDVFKTFGEIQQAYIILQAAARQKYIDQAQSINLMIHPSATLKDVNELMINAWSLGVKTLYYQRSTNPAQEYARELLSCAACEA